MTLWQGGLFALAAFAAVRTLAALMIYHRRQFREQLLLEERQQRKPRSQPGDRQPLEQRASEFKTISLSNPPA